MRLITGAALALSVFAATASRGQTYQSCTEPYPPGCIDQFGTFDDEWSFDRCRRDVENYINEVTNFRDCLARWHEAVGNEVDDIVDRFNCKARDELFCP